MKSKITIDCVIRKITSWHHCTKFRREEKKETFFTQINCNELGFNRSFWPDSIWRLPCFKCRLLTKIGGERDLPVAYKFFFFFFQIFPSVIATEQTPICVFISMKVFTFLDSMTDNRFHQKIFLSPFFDVRASVNWFCLKGGSQSDR